MDPHGLGSRDRHVDGYRPGDDVYVLDVPGGPSKFRHDERYTVVAVSDPDGVILNDCDPNWVRTEHIQSAEVHDSLKFGNTSYLLAAFIAGATAHDIESNDLRRESLNGSLHERDNPFKKGTLRYEAWESGHRSACGFICHVWANFPDYEPGS